MDSDESSVKSTLTPTTVAKPGSHLLADQDVEFLGQLNSVYFDEIKRLIRKKLKKLSARSNVLYICSVVSRGLNVGNLLRLSLMLLCTITCCTTQSIE